MVDIVIENTNQKTKLKYNICCPLEPKCVNSNVGVVFIVCCYDYDFILLCSVVLLVCLLRGKKMLTSVGFRWRFYHISQNSAVKCMTASLAGPEVSKVTGVPCLQWADLLALPTVLLAPRSSAF